MFDNDVLVIQHTLSSCNKCIFIHWMNTLIITEAELIIKGDATVQLRISGVGMRHMHFSSVTEISDVCCESLDFMEFSR